MGSTGKMSVFGTHSTVTPTRLWNKAFLLPSSCLNSIYLMISCRQKHPSGSVEGQARVLGYCGSKESGVKHTKEASGGFTSPFLQTAQPAEQYLTPPVV